jgi:hypothetical protein
MSRSFSLPASPSERITSFFGGYRFLSNFWPARVRLDGDPFLYPTVEHAYQAAKTDLRSRAALHSARTPVEAKRQGRTLLLLPDWESRRLTVMRELLRQKFAHPDLRRLLLATGDAELVEGNTWGDTFWGVCKGCGQNHLGRQLMAIRAEIRTAAS